MSYPSVPNLFVNNPTINTDADKLNENFTAMVSAMSDGTKDFNINAMTTNGAVSCKYLLPNSDAARSFGTAILRHKDFYSTGLTTGGLTANAEVLGDTVSLDSMNIIIGPAIADGYWNGAGGTFTTERVYFTMPRAGYVSGMKISGHISSFSSSFYVSSEVKINGASKSVVPFYKLTQITASGFFSASYGGSFSFSAGDRLSTYFATTLIPPSIIGNLRVDLLIRFDT